MNIFSWFKKKKDAPFIEEDDDGVQFQWGDRYIKYQETIKDVGGKYWKWNKDGSITEFKPAETRLRVAENYLSANKGKVLERKFPDYILIEFENDRAAKDAAEKLNGAFMAARSIFAINTGKLLKIECVMKSVFESTYFPGRSRTQNEDD